MDKKSVAKNYRFLAILLSCMVAGALLGWFRPKWGHNIAFLRSEEHTSELQSPS